MNWLTIAKADINNKKNYIQDVIDGRINGITITNVLSDEELNSCVENIYKNFQHNASEHLYSELQHDAHLGAYSDFEKYLAQSASHSQHIIQKLGFDFSLLFQEIISSLSFSQVNTPSYKHIAYKSCVVKIWNEGQELLPHYDAVIQESPEGTHLSSLGNTQNIISFILMLQAPDGGGELLIHDLNYENTPATFKPLTKITQKFMKVYLDKQQIQTVNIPPKENCLVIFAGGKNWHSVSPVTGSKARISIGGLMMPSFDNTHLYYWG